MFLLIYTNKVCIILTARIKYIISYIINVFNYMLHLINIIINIIEIVMNAPIR